MSWQPDPRDGDALPRRPVRHRDHPAGHTPGAPLRRALTYTVLAVTILHLAALAALWPRGPAPAAAGSARVASEVTYSGGEVVTTDSTTCPGTTDTRLPDGSIPATTTCDYATVRLDSGAEAGISVTVAIPPGFVRAGLAPGDDVRIARYPAAQGQPATYAFEDFTRERPLGLLGVVLVLLVVVVARIKGLMALLGLGLGFATIGAFLLPALHRGQNATLVSAVGAGAIMIVVLYASHGISTKTTTALFGTLAGIWTTAGLATWVTSAAHLNGLGSEENAVLSRLTTGGSLSSLVLAGIVLAGLGVLNDVTITQASAVWELRRHAPHLNVRALFTAGMRIGRDHLASTIYTIAFAYAGVALPTLLLVSLYGTPTRQLLNGSQLAEEVARTLTASIGLVLAIPLTTLIAAVLARHARADSPRQAPDDLGYRPPHLH